MPHSWEPTIRRVEAELGRDIPREDGLALCEAAYQETLSMMRAAARVLKATRTAREAQADPAQASAPPADQAPGWESAHRARG